MATQYTPEWSVAYPDGASSVNVPTSMQEAAFSTDAALSEAVLTAAGYVTTLAEGANLDSLPRWGRYYVSSFAVAGTLVPTPPVAWRAAGALEHFGNVQRFSNVHGQVWVRTFDAGAWSRWQRTDVPDFPEPNSFALWGDSMTAPANGYGPAFAASTGATVYNGGIPGDTYDGIAARQGGRPSATYPAGAAPGEQYRDRHAILWSGRNSFDDTDPGPIVASIRNMADFLRPRVRRFLVLQIAPWSSETPGTTGRQRLDATNAAIKAAFPDQWVDIADWLRTDEAAAVAGITWTAQDQADIANQVTPTSFRVDMGHLNATGNAAVAWRLHTECHERGWLASPPA